MDSIYYDEGNAYCGGQLAGTATRYYEQANDIAATGANSRPAYCVGRKLFWRRVLRRF